LIAGFLCAGTLLAQTSVRRTPNTSQSKSPSLSLGEIANGIYRNPLFGFSYKVPYGWVDRTDEMRQDDSGKPADTSKGAVLLAIFERPPQARGETINSSVVIAAESASAYPGIKSAAQYFGPLNEVISKQGLKAVNEPYEFPVDGQPIVRCDYTGPLGSVTLHQSTLAMPSKGYVVSFTFVGGTEDQVTELLESLSFGKSKGR
jgi:hypothetical protein